jgi:hypothetical protein
MIYAADHSRYAEIMRVCRQVLLTILLLAGLGLAAWCYVCREPLARQWSLYRVGAAATPREAEAELVRCETDPDPDAMIGELVDKWGTGNRQFDLRVAGHLDAPSCGESLRKAFAGQIGRQRELLQRWAHYWSWRSPLPLDQQTASVVAYLDLAAADPSRTITWREVLDVQALFELTGRGELASELSPSNWRDRYRQWQRRRPAELPHAPRPKEPFP